LCGNFISKKTRNLSEVLIFCFFLIKQKEKVKSLAVPIN